MQDRLTWSEYISEDPSKHSETHVAPVVECKLCNQKFRYVANHLKRSRRMSLETYKARRIPLKKMKMNLK